MSNDLIPLKHLNPIEVFSKEGGLDPIIQKIKEQARAVVSAIAKGEVSNVKIVY